MTREQVCALLGKSPSTLIHQFKRTKKNLEKKGIILEKEGNGINAVYNVRFVDGTEIEVETKTSIVVK